MRDSGAVRAAIMKPLRVKCQLHKCLDGGASLRLSATVLLKLAILNHLLIEMPSGSAVDDRRSVHWNESAAVVSVSGIQIGEGGASVVA